MILADVPAWSAWADVTPIVVSAPASSFARVRLPQDIAPGADGSYDDLRVVDDAGREVPYALDPAHAGSASRDVPVVDTGFIPGSGTQAVADLGSSRAIEDSITLAIDASAEPTYFESVDLEASDDLKVWRSIRTDAIVYRVDQDAGHGNQTISFPATRSRWLRVRIRNAHAAFPITGASVAKAAPAPPGLLPYAVKAMPATPAATNDRVWRFDSAVGLRPAAVRFATKGTFLRSVLVEASDDEKTWDAFGRDAIASYADGSSHLEFAFDERTTKHVRITISNGNDAPIDARPSLLYVPHYVVFALASSRRYHFVSGDRNAGAPAYDLADKLAHQTWSETDARAGATRRNPDFAEAIVRPDRSPLLVTIAIVVVAVLLGTLAIMTIRSAKEVTE